MSLSASSATAAPSIPKSRRLSPKRRAEIRILTLKVLQDLVQFRSTHDLVDFIRDEGIVNYTDLETRLHNNYPVGATAIEATRANLDGRPDVEDGGFLRCQMPLAPEQISGHLWQYPLEAASATYAFALVELYGQALTDVLRPEPLSRTWHGPVSEKQEVEAHEKQFRNGLAANFAVAPKRVSTRLLLELQAIKRLRNEIVHEAREQVRFHAFYADLIRLVCRLHFMLVTSDRHITVCPWPDMDGLVGRPGGEGVFDLTPG